MLFQDLVKDKLYILLMGLIRAGWAADDVKLPVTICGSSIISPEEPTCITLYITASEIIITMLNLKSSKKIS